MSRSSPLTSGQTQIPSAAAMEAVSLIWTPVPRLVLAYGAEEKLSPINSSLYFKHPHLSSLRHMVLALPSAPIPGAVSCPSSALWKVMGFNVCSVAYSICHSFLCLSNSAPVFFLLTGMIVKYDFRIPAMVDHGKCSFCRIRELGMRS